MRTRYRHLALALLLTLPTSDVYPQATTRGDRQYLVEVVVFENRGPDSSDGELWEPTLNLDPPTSDQETQTNAPVHFVDGGALARVIDDLNGTGRYAVVTTTAWVQSLSAKPSAPLVDIGRHDPRITGNVRLYEHRLLFLDVNLALQRQPSTPSWSSAPYFASTYRAPTYEMNETRRIKLNDIHYFDHPYFGALVKVTRLDAG